MLNCKLKKNQQTGRSLGFAYLTVKEKEAYDRLLEETIEFQGRIIEIKPIWKKKELGDQLEKEKNKKLFVSNLPQGLTNSELMAYFSQYGQISNAYIIKDPDTKNNRSYGYIIFKHQIDFDAFFSREGPHILRKGTAEVNVERCLNHLEIKEKKLLTKGRNRMRKPEMADTRSRELYVAKPTTLKKKGSETLCSPLPDSDLSQPKSRERVDQSFSGDEFEELLAQVKSVSASLDMPYTEECQFKDHRGQHLMERRQEEVPNSRPCSSDSLLKAMFCTKAKGKARDDKSSLTRQELLISAVLKEHQALNQDTANYRFNVFLGPRQIPTRPDRKSVV